MAINTSTGLTGINSAQPLEALKKGTSVPVGDEFRRALDQIQSSNGIAGPQAKSAANALGQAPASALKFSNHAVERMRSRGINFQPEEMRNIESAITKAAGKGAKDTLVLSGDNALVVSVKNNTVVTVMDRAAMKDNVFTNIDSTVII